MIKNSELALISDHVLAALRAPRPASAPRPVEGSRTRRADPAERVERTAGTAPTGTP